MAWVQTSSPTFVARHEESDYEDAVGVLELLEGTRERLSGAFSDQPAEVAVVLHGSGAQLALAQPYLPLLRTFTAPAGRRYLAGWYSAREVHVLAPRLLAQRASNVAGSREMIMLTPAALYAQLVVGHHNPGLPPPFRPSSLLRSMRWPWLAAGAGQYFSGQSGYARPAIARRLREGPRPPFPPGLRDAPLLGGTVFDLLVNEEGQSRAVELALTPPQGSPREALTRAFSGRPLMHTEGNWRTHLSRLAGA
jgi:hypothetical protein